MDRWVAFLRAINTGKRRVAGDRLVGIFESVGCEEVSSYQASGNILFSTEAPDRVEVERALRDELGYEVPTVLRTGSTVREIALATPFEQRELEPAERRIQVILLRDPAPPDALMSACSSGPEDDVLRPRGSEIFWLPRSGISDSTLDLGALERELGPVTVRTHATIGRLVGRL